MTVVLPALGNFLVNQRTAHRWKQSQAVDIAASRHLAISYQALRQLEAGTTANPAPDLLRAIARLYGLPYDELVRRFVTERYGVELTSDEYAARANDWCARPHQVVLENQEPELLDAWRASSADGQATALVVLTAAKRPGARRRRIANSTHAPGRVILLSTWREGRGRW